MKRKASLLAIILISLVGLPSAAFAHAGVVATSPVQDQVLMSMAREISIQFSEELLTIENQNVNTISLTELDGPEIELENVIVDGAFLKAEIPIGDYAPGTYEVNYRIVSADGHKVADSFTFSLNAPAVTATAAPVEDGGGVIPLPIVAAIAIILIAGGFLLFRARKP
jgi:methionine-rich copper-binding protein CopC